MSTHDCMRMMDHQHTVSLGSFIQRALHFPGSFKAGPRKAKLGSFLPVRRLKALFALAVHGCASLCRCEP